jgi:hypothetical protein
LSERENRTFSLSDEDLPAALLFIVLAAIACSIPAQSDTFYHLRAGRVMIESGQLLERELFSHATYGEAHPNHWWLSQLLFYGLYAVGGPLLLTVAAGGCALLAVAGAWRFTRGTAEVRLLLLLILMLTLPAWSVRPQVFSLLLMVVTIRLVLADRLAWLPLVMVLWANVHAVVVLGIAVVCVVFVEALVWSRDRIGRTLWIAGASAAAPMVSPLGVHYWPYVLKVVREARMLGIYEYRSAFSLEVDAAALWLVIALLGGIAVRQWRTLATRDRGDRILLLASAVLAVSAAVSVRNTAFFAIAAAPALGRWTAVPLRRRSRPANRAAYAFITVAALAAIGGVSYRWRDGGTALGWRPFTPEALRAIRECPPPMYNGFNDGGLLIWFAPGQRVFVDGRSDAYPLELLLRASRAELRGDYKELFGEYRFNCAVVGAKSVIARALGSDASMRLHFSDERWAVFHAIGR